MWQPPAMTHGLGVGVFWRVNNTSGQATSEPSHPQTHSLLQAANSVAPPALHTQRGVRSLPGTSVDLYYSRNSR